MRRKAERYQRIRKPASDLFFYCDRHLRDMNRVPAPSTAPIDSLKGRYAANPNQNAKRERTGVGASILEGSWCGGCPSSESLQGSRGRFPSAIEEANGYPRGIATAILLQVDWLWPESICVPSQKCSGTGRSRSCGIPILLRDTPGLGCR
jgi:hypothetical protein